MAQDIAGRTLEVGQVVAYSMPVTGKLETGTIVLIRAQTVELDDKASADNDWGIRRNHAEVCIIEEAP